MTADILAPGAKVQQVQTVCDALNVPYPDYLSVVNYKAYVSWGSKSVVRLLLGPVPKRIQKLFTDDEMYAYGADRQKAVIRLLQRISQETGITVALDNIGGLAIHLPKYEYLEEVYIHDDT